MHCDFGSKGMSTTLYNFVCRKYGALGLCTAEQIDYYQKTGECISVAEAYKIYGKEIPATEF